MDTPSFEGCAAPQLEEAKHLHVESPDEDMFHPFSEDPLESSPLDLEVPSSLVATKIVIPIPSIAGNKWFQKMLIL